MAKCRFPGKALKLNCKKRVKFRNCFTANNTEDRYLLKIVRGYELFRELFGASEEEDENDFIGFDDRGSKSKKLCQRLHQRGYVELAEPKQPLGSSTKHDHIAGTAKRKVGRPKNTSTVALANNLYHSQKGETINPPEELHAQLQEAKNTSSIVSARSPRILKPIKRLVEDDAEYDNEWDVEDSEEDKEIQVVQQAVATKVKRPVGRPRKSPSLLGIPSRNIPTPEPEVGGDRVSRNISLYADTISSHATQGVSRPPRRGTQDGDTPNSAVASRILPASAAASSKVQEKIEKILQSPWDGRVKQATATAKPSSSCDSPSKAPLSSVAVSKNILRKARLHLNKRTLQKIRNPVSVQHLLQQPGEDSGVSSCGVCQVRGMCEHQYGMACCHNCSSFLTSLSEQPLATELPCSRGYGGCQLVGISIEERCNACWLSHALLSCTLPSLMHDRLRKKLPQHLKERVPTSLARSVYITEMGGGGGSGSEQRTHGRLARTSGCGGGSASVCNEASSLEAPPLLSGMFGSIIDLPGGWKRKTGPEVLVISPSGEKFKSIPKLEEYLLKQGICTDASILFGGAAAVTAAASDASSNHLTGEDGDVKSKSKKKKKKKKKHKSHSHDVNPLRLSSSNNNCVLTTLPGGWVRRIRFRSVSTASPHRRFDVYVTSPDGRTFRSKKQLSAYFQQIGKVDDILKYFPLFHEQGGGDQVATSSERTETESSTEPGSSSELWSEVEPDASEVISDAEEIGDETPQERRHVIKPATGNVRPASISSLENSGGRSSRGGLSFVPVEDASQRNFVGFEKSESVVQTGNANSLISENVKANYNDLCKEINVGSVLDDSFDDSSSTCDTIPSDSVMKSKRSSVSIHLPSLPCMNFLPPDEPKDSGEESRHDGLFNKPLVPIVKKSKRQMGKSEKLLNLPKVEATFRLDLPKIPKLTIPKKITSPESSLNSVDVQSSPPTELHHNTPKNSNPFKPVSVYPEEITDLIPKNDATVPEVILPEPQIKSLVSTFKAFQTQHIGGGWSRKIKWNPDGTGKVSFVITPSGSKIQSMIELQGYLKKEGAPTSDASFYFPQQLNREDVPEKVLPTPRVLKVKTPVSNDKVAGKKKAAQDGGISLGVGTPGTTAGAAAEQKEGGVDARQDVGADSAAVGADSGGPRIKRVCRSLEQALGMPRATFPVPEDKENKDVLETESDFTSNDSSAQTSDTGIAASSAATGRMKKAKKTAKVYSVMTTAAGKILRKTQWCNRCSGCLIPNCRKCGNCMDMVKYGGPGTKKKPCVQRKCINPRLSVHSFHKPQQMQQHNPIPRTLADNSSTPATGPAFPTIGAGAATGKKMPPIKVTKRQTKKMAEMQKRAAEMHEEGEKAEREEEDELAEDYAREVEELMREQERIVFVPRQMARPVQEIKERSDAAGGKSVVPGALVNIDYWQGYDEDEVLEQGFPVLQAAPLHLSPLCFRCGSKGKEEMLWCSWCCEGVHPYCLEEGEGPQSSREECCWVCRRCAVCHVCGAGGITEAETASLQLMRCSACFYYYHLECLGPGAHETCTPPNDALWEGEMLMHLHRSWPLPPPIFRVQIPPSSSCQDIPPSALPQSAHDKMTHHQTQSTAAAFGTSCCLLNTSDFSRVIVKSASLESAEGREIVSDPLTDELDTTVLTLLESGPGLCQQSLMCEPRCFVLPQPESPTGASKKDDLPLDLPEVTCVADEIDGFDLMEMDGIDLDAIMDGLDEEDEDFNIMDPQFDEEDVIELFTDVDFELAPRVPDISKGDILPDVYGIEDDEYLCLGYKKITEYPPTRFELSDYRTLQMLHTELFIALGCPTVKQLEKRKLIYYRPRGRRRIPHCRVMRPYREDSETDTASEGTEESDDDSDLDWESLLEIRRHEALEELKERMELKGLQQKRLKEMEVEREQQIRNKGCRERMRKKLNKCLKKRRIENRRVSADQEEGGAADVGDVDDEMWEPNAKKKKRKYKRRTLQVGEGGEEEEEEKKTVNWDDEVYFWELSDVDEAHEHVDAERLVRWQPQSFEELDALFEERSLQRENDPTAEDHDEGDEGDDDASGEGGSRGVMEEVGSVGDENADERRDGESNEMVASKESTDTSSTAKAMKKLKKKKMLVLKENRKIIKRKKKLKKNLSEDNDRRQTVVKDSDQKEEFSDSFDAPVNHADNAELPDTPKVKKKRPIVKKLHFDEEPHSRKDKPPPNDRWPTLTKLKETLLDRRKRPSDEPGDEPCSKKVSVNDNTIECDIEIDLDESPRKEKSVDDSNNSNKENRNSLCQLLDCQVTSGSSDDVFLDLGFDDSGNEKSVVIEVMVTGEDSADEGDISPDFNLLASDAEDNHLVTGRKNTTSRLSIGKDGLYYLEEVEDAEMKSAGGSTFIVDEDPLSADGGPVDCDIQPTLSENATTTPVSSTRSSRRLGHGRASELASLRKARMDM